MTRDYKAGLSFACGSVVLVSIAQLLLKIAVMRSHGIGDLLSHEIPIDPTAVFALGGGLLCYGLSFIIWQHALNDLPLSVAYPLLGLSYPLVYIATLTLPVFTETINPQRIGGIVLVLAGVALLAPKDSLACKDDSVQKNNAKHTHSR